MIQRFFLGTLAPLLLIGCADISSSDPTVTVLDSAGITIVESSVPVWGPGEGWTVDPEPSMDLTTTGTGMPHEFYGVGDATRLLDGVIAVANGGTREIRLYSPQGLFLHSLGREGEGPGEFRALTSIAGYRGDSLFAFDHGLRRVTIFPREGTPRFVRFINTAARDVSPMEGGELLLRMSSRAIDDYRGEDGPLFRGEDPIIRFSPSGDFLDTLVNLAGFEERLDVGMALFGKDSHFAVHGEEVYVGDADLMEFKVFSGSGRLEKIVRVPGFDLHITPEDIVKEKSARLGPDPSPTALRGFSALSLPETKPAYSDLLVDAMGCVWTREYQHIWAERRAAPSTREPSNWTVFDPDGRWLGSVIIPPRFLVFEIGPDFVLGLGRDGLDVQHVQLLRLNRH